MKLTENLLPRALRLFLILFVTGLFGPALSTSLSAEQSLAEKTSETVKDATRATSDSVESLMNKIDANGLSDRSPEELGGLVIIALLVGSMIGVLPKLKSLGMGRLAKFLLGLAGAVVGSLAVRTLDISFDWGLAIISYEELLFSVIGAIVLVVLGRAVGKAMSSKGKSGK